MTRDAATKDFGAVNITIERVEKHLSERIDDVRDNLASVAVNRPDDQGVPDDVLAAPSAPSGGGSGGLNGDCDKKRRGESTYVDPCPPFGSDNRTFR